MDGARDLSLEAGCKEALSPAVVQASSKTKKKAKAQSSAQEAAARIKAKAIENKKTKTEEKVEKSRHEALERQFAKGSGDDTRSWGPPFVGTESVYFLSVNRNKKSIAINMKKAKGAKIIKELAAVCDVLVENYVPGKLAGMGLGYDDINTVAPHIIYCSITGILTSV
ncbi:CaiB/baiF CoA-transferase family protein C7orf10, partial [Ophiophagus hannah]